MPDDTVKIYSGSDAQPLLDQIKIGGRPFPLGNTATVKFRMRIASSGELKVDEDATVTDESKGQVSYDWQDVDLDTPGEYFGWWNVDLDTDGELDTSEFPILIMEHSPGMQTRVGAIYRRARGIIPITWDALEKTPKYGDSLLQETIESVKLSVFNSSIPVANEATYDLRVINYVAKLVVLEVIPAGADYWMSNPITVSTAPTKEVVSYTDRAAGLWKIYERLLIEVSNDRVIIEDLLDIPISRSDVSVPEFSPGTEEGFKTPLPGLRFPDYAFPSSDLDWW